MKQWELRGITDRAEARVEVDPSVLRSLRLLVDQFPAMIWTTDAELRFSSSLGGELTDLGLGPNQMVGTTVFDVFDTDDPSREPIASHYRALTGASAAFEFDWAGRRFGCRVAPLLDAEGRAIGTVGVAVDLSDDEMAKRRAGTHLAVVG